MFSLRYSIKSDWHFYLLIVAYGGLVGRMTLALWFGEGVNIYETYSSASDATEMLIDANYVYWSKTGFLFLSLFLVSLNFDYRFAVGVACSFWSISLISMFGGSLVLFAAAALGIVLVAIQVRRRGVIDVRRGTEESKQA